MTQDEQDYQDYLDYQDYVAYQKGEYSTKPSASMGDLLRGGVVSAANSALFGFGDEAAAGVRSVLPGYGSYDEELNAIRGGIKDFSKQHPVASAAGDITGALVTLPIGGGALKGGSLASKLGRAAAEGAATGAAYGFGEGEGGFSERAQNAAKTGAISGVFSPVVAGAGSVFSKLGSKADDVAASMNRKSLGARQGDYQKSLVELADSVESLDSLATLKTETTLDSLLDSKVFGSTRDPRKLMPIVEKKQADLAHKIDKAIRVADVESGVKKVPDWEEAMSFIMEGKVEGDKVEQYFNRLAKLDEAIKREGKGSLPYLQQQKIAYGRMWDAKDKTLNNFNRAIYADLQKTIEKAAPAVKPLNEELSKYLTVKPIIQRSLAAKKAENLPGKFFEGLRTSGGAGVLFGSGVATGNAPLIAAGGAALAARSPRGQAELARIGRGVANVATPTGRGVDSVFATSATPRVLSALTADPSSQPQQQSAVAYSPSQAPFGYSSNSKQYPTAARRSTPEVSRQTIPSQESASKPDEIQAVFNKIKEDLVRVPKNDKEFGLLLDAVREIESSGGKYLESSAGALGPYQFMPATAKAYGLDDPYDEVAARDAASRLINDEVAALGSLELGLAAYNAGRPTVSRAVKKAGSKEWEEVAKYLPRETREYVPKIEDVFERLLKKA